jgi:hypothetical protein
MIAAEQMEGRCLLLDDWLNAAKPTATLVDDWLHFRRQTGFVFPERTAADCDFHTLATLDSEMTAPHHIFVENEQFSSHLAGFQQHCVPLASTHFVREEAVLFLQAEQNGHGNVAAIPLAAGVSDVWTELDSAVLA